MCMPFTKRVINPYYNDYNAMKAYRKVTVVGDSIGITIPRDWGYEKGDFVILELNGDGSITVRKVR